MTGQVTKLVRKTRSGSRVRFFKIELDESFWSKLITGGLADNVVSLPDSLAPIPPPTIICNEEL